MSIIVRVPASLSHLTNGNKMIECSGTTVAECIDSMETQFPGIKEKLCDQDGKLLGYVNLYVNGDNIRYLKDIATPLKTGDEVSIIPAVAGG